MATPREVKELFELASTGRLTKSYLAAFLTSQAREAFLDKCRLIEQELTQSGATKGDPCLASGCAFDGVDEACLNAVLAVDGEHMSRCMSAWSEIFRDQNNRLLAWKTR